MSLKVSDKFKVGNIFTAEFLVLGVNMNYTTTIVGKFEEQTAEHFSYYITSPEHDLTMLDSNTYKLIKISNYNAKPEKGNNSDDKNR